MSKLWWHHCEPRGKSVALFNGDVCVVCGTQQVLPSAACPKCVILQNQLDNALAEINRLRALNPREPVRQHLG